MALDARFRRAIALLEAASGEDPETETAGGAERPRELVYAERMSRWIERLVPEAPEALRLAARCQHLRRWEVPRSDYPMDRAGYHLWRTAAARHHAETAGEILKQAGYDDATIARVQSLVRKERLQRDPETQALEDAACLVFIEHALADFAARHPTGKVIDIVQKTWRKMSERGHREALDLELPPQARAVIGRALGRS